MCTSLLPFLRQSPIGGRIVNLSSVASSLKMYSPAMRARFRNPDLTFPELEAILKEYEVSSQCPNAKDFPNRC